MNDRHTVPPYSLRMPEELRSQLEDAAKSTKRSLNAEIVARLEASFALSIPAAGSSIEDLNLQRSEVASQISNLRRVIRGREAGLDLLQKQLNYLTHSGQHTKAEAVTAIIEATTAEITALEQEHSVLRELQHEMDSRLAASMYISDVRDR
ncbi:Arc family DNA-binding protein [Pseudomonas sp. JH-2]|uniref:Arc family DNA-binding protein n=1 Tax=Pseudomonas sp. JH-2 TaxID=3114998 RepID=UPI002E25ECEE|nr:Arc family DNA-binding protein [Pseudomonas sp. JH-2]